MPGYQIVVSVVREAGFVPICLPSEPAPSTRQKATALVQAQDDKGLGNHKNGCGVNKDTASSLGDWIGGEGVVVTRMDESRRIMMRVSEIKR